ncbi:Bifunctional purine biosynthetic protein ade1 [Bachmanniomyces sp. S44760]|nr:Bifunctional purine biosynthetic protein ade1 [Bachmanniomyces sp. S44760]
MAYAAGSLTATDLKGVLRLVARGKVRDLYEIDSKSLLFVATDRISAYDVIMQNGVPEKGALLTAISVHWFSVLSNALPELRTHLISAELPSQIPESLHRQLESRCMQVRKLRVFPLEAIIRGYLTGSAWSEYQAKGTVHGMQLSAGLRESQELPGGAMYTPSTKADAGQHDENIHPDEAATIIGEKYADAIKNLSLQLYKTARQYAIQRGIIIADTKFEFGLDEEKDEIVLVDEVLTPDSSRFWPAAAYEIGKSQESFDKQYLRDYLTDHGLKGKEGVHMPEHVVNNTRSKYVEAYEKLVGRKWEDTQR